MVQTMVCVVLVMPDAFSDSDDEWSSHPLHPFRSIPRIQDQPADKSGLCYNLSLSGMYHPFLSK
jgi:hypothetical protein